MMIRSFFLIQAAFSSVTTETRIPFISTRSERGPLISVDVQLDGTEGTLRLPVSLELNDASRIAISNRLTTNRSDRDVIGSVFLSDQISLNHEVYLYEQQRGLYQISGLDLRPVGPFRGQVESIMITPTELIIDPTYPEAECEFPLVTISAGGSTSESWTFTNANNLGTVFFHTHSPIELSTLDFTNFIRGIDETLLQETGSHLLNSNGEYLVINHLSLDELDEILPVLRYTVRGIDSSSDINIEISAKNYLVEAPNRFLRVSSNGGPIEPNRFRIRIRSVNNDNLTTIGDALFKKHAVLLNYNTGAIRICKARI